MPFDHHLARCAAAIAALALLPLAAAAQELGRGGSIATGGAGPNGAASAVTGVAHHGDKASPRNFVDVQSKRNEGSRT